MIPALTTALSFILYHGYEGTEGVTGFPNIGTYLIFGVILVPVYVMVAAWFIGQPRDTKTGLLGVSYLVGITAQMWIGMFILTIIIGVVFYGGLPEPFAGPGP
ncbi:uncharacterized protein Nmag_3542 [Natrialba magadii ATCC 43099]|uniref:Uncharacterized protein n=1 Tax=Natrialba magadii (strain ATCC 43099 / DSM 3394 / CCM 3739 / CIP 104546 / IAM 13178 / JCM 8861 / NBRC 102185 / NCIMB 2190 / MS3) TaxID=547559 RepID=D3SU03_NATMM|nr:hypothetical protein [Natrialba magadii]ADD07092.1 uncharacterized protein Nmag_3542 [Natrialba magadii ATCC 43099]ELY28765.1 hypothetical protein C500_12505 [Natrialba magadii ATCC 43099]